MMTFSCKDCTAPKRYPGCHAHCPEYLAEKAQYDELKEAYDKRKRVTGDIISQRTLKWYKATKNRRRGW